MRTQKMTQKQSQVLNIATTRYPQWASFSNAEKVLQIAAVLCDDIKVREIGNNDGSWIRDFQHVAGAANNSPWCASMIYWIFDLLDLPRPRHGASVLGWQHFATQNNLLRTKATRGCLSFWLNENLTGHIGVVVNNLPLVTKTIEGNTTPNITGNQREGNGLFRRIRNKRIWNGYIIIE